MRVFINAIFAHILLNAYVFWRGRQIIPLKRAYRLSFYALFVGELTIYTFGFIFVDEISIDLLYPVMLIGTSWAVFLLYMTGFLAVYDAISYLKKRLNLLPELNLSALPARRIYYAISAAAVALIMCCGNYRFRHPAVTEVNLGINKPAPFKELKIVMAADIHAGYMVNGKTLKMYIDRIMEQKPDLILLVGDIIDYDIRPLDEQRMDTLFRRLKAPLGVYASTGNHEYRLDGEAKISWLKEKAGLTMLRDSVVKVAGAFYIVGREDDKAPARKKLKELMRQVDKSKPVIVINHEPKRLQEEADEQVDMAFYGHTHGGQIFPYNLVIDLLYELGYGYKKKGDTHIYVTSGLGLSGPQYRIGTLSEIVVIKARFETERQTPF
ncbi:MAG: metallophosphoesterase [Prevotella sp.]|jgi:predicted MPP superfamily phosphohydrolase|nr:metallophosphoesterase [Prevotella sp.]